MGRKGYMRLARDSNEMQLLEREHRDENVLKILRHRTILLIVCVVLLATNIISLAVWSHSIQGWGSGLLPEDAYPSAKNSVEYHKERLWRDIAHNNLTGGPRQEFDQAWHELLQPMAIKISQDELDTLNDTSIAFKDGSGYLAEMAVYHELHCIKRIRQHLSLDHYYPDLSEEELFKENAHIDHCLEYWRVAATCRGDTSLATFFWAPDGKAKTKNYSDHVCVDFEKIDAFARERMVYITDYSGLAGDPNA